MARRIKAARFPAVKSIDTLDFTAIQSVNRQLMTQLACCEYIERQEDVIAIGNRGTGKTRIALGLGLAATVVHYYSAIDTQHLLTSGIPINYLSRWLGHSSIQTTLICLELVPQPIGSLAMVP